MGRLFRAHLFRYGMRVLPDRDVVEDTIQELFLEVWQAGERLADLEDVNAEKAYLLKSLRYKLQRVQSGASRRSSLLVIDPVSTGSEWAWIDEEAESQQRKQLDLALSRLTPRQQEAIHLRFFEQLEYDQISVTMQMSNQAARNLVCRALKVLREHLLLLILLILTWTGSVTIAMIPADFIH